MIKTLFVMDDIASINIQKDTTYVIMLESQKRGHSLHYCEISDLFIKDATSFANAWEVEVKKSSDYYELGKRVTVPLESFDIVWMRKDPPFDLEYIYATYILEMVDESSTVVINHPRGIRNSNEKLYSLHFKSYIPQTLVTRDISLIKQFLRETGGKIVVKPLEGYGGEGIFFIQQGDPNESAILDTITNYGKRFVMAQKFIENVYEGDKRVIMLGGNPIGAVLRVPRNGEFRCNFHSGGSPAPTELTERDREICNAIAPKLREDKLHLVGIDIVGGYLTEVNTTSPTCVQEINAFNGTRLEKEIVDFAEKLLSDAKGS